MLALTSPGGGIPWGFEKNVEAGIHSTAAFASPMFADSACALQILRHRCRSGSGPGGKCRHARRRDAAAIGDVARRAVATRGEVLWHVRCAGQPRPFFLNNFSAHANGERRGARSDRRVASERSRASRAFWLPFGLTRVLRRSPSACPDILSFLKKNGAVWNRPKSSGIGGMLLWRCCCCSASGRSLRYRCRRARLFFSFWIPRSTPTATTPDDRAGQSEGLAPLKESCRPHREDPFPTCQTLPIPGPRRRSLAFVGASPSACR